MKISITVGRNCLSDLEEFEMAIKFSAETLSNLLYKHEFCVDLVLPNTIQINSEFSAFSAPLDRLIDLIKSAFVDSDHDLYPEFSKVILSKTD